MIMSSLLSGGGGRNGEYGNEEKENADLVNHWTELIISMVKMWLVFNEIFTLQEHLLGYRVDSGKLNSEHKLKSPLGRFHVENLTLMEE